MYWIYDYVTLARSSKSAFTIVFTTYLRLNDQNNMAMQVAQRATASAETQQEEEENCGPLPVTRLEVSASKNKDKTFSYR